MNIGPIQLPQPFCQAGLAGYSDRAMRLVARRSLHWYATIVLLVLADSSSIRAADPATLPADAPATRPSKELPATTEVDALAVGRLVQDLQSSGDGFFNRGRSYESVNADLDAMGDRAVAPLIRLLESPSQRMRQVVALELGRIRHPAAVDPLIALIRSNPADPMPVDRVTAIDALGKIGDTTAATAVLERLDEANPKIRSAAVVAIAKLAPNESKGRIRKMLTDDKEISVRAACATALVDLNDMDAIPQLLVSLGDDSWVASASALALAKMGRDDGAAQLLSSLETLGGAPRPAGLIKRIEIIDLLGKLHVHSARPALEKLAAEDDDPAITFAARKALKQIDG